MDDFLEKYIWPKFDPIWFWKLNRLIFIEEVEIFLKNYPTEKHQAQVVSQGNSTTPSKTISPNAQEIFQRLG